MHSIFLSQSFIRIHHRFSLALETPTPLASQGAGFPLPYNSAPFSPLYCLPLLPSHSSIAAIITAILPSTPAPPRPSPSSLLKRHSRNPTVLLACLARPPPRTAIAITRSITAPAPAPIISSRFINLHMGLELELLPSHHHQLPPIRTAAAPPTPRPGGDGDDNAADLDGGCATPKSAASVLRAPSTCPPAPRKPRPAKRKLPTPHHRVCSCAAAAPHPAPVRWFIAVPHDVLAAVFVARPASAPCPSSTSSPASKKIRVHVVGS